MRSLFDTNILIDYLCGKEEAKTLLQKSSKPAISIISKMEILAGVEENEFKITQDFLEHFDIIDLNLKVAEIASQIRWDSKIKLPDAIVWASAKSIGAVLVTNNTLSFSSHSADVKIPYPA